MNVFGNFLYCFNEVQIYLFESKGCRWKSDVGAGPVSTQLSDSALPQEVLGQAVVVEI